MKRVVGSLSATGLFAWFLTVVSGCGGGPIEKAPPPEETKNMMQKYDKKK